MPLLTWWSLDNGRGMWVIISAQRTWIFPVTSCKSPDFAHPALCSFLLARRLERFIAEKIIERNGGFFHCHVWLSEATHLSGSILHKSPGVRNQQLVWVDARVPDHGTGELFIAHGCFWKCGIPPIVPCCTVALRPPVPCATYPPLPFWDGWPCRHKKGCVGTYCTPKSTASSSFSLWNADFATQPTIISS